MPTKFYIQNNIPKQAIEEISRTSMVVAAFSTIVEWYDFTLYLYFATVLSRVFFGGGETSLALTLAGFAISYLMRPFGAMFFGYIGDRHGRRRMLLLSMACVTITMLITALLPTYQQIGAAAGVLVLLLRAIMAFSVGGEYTGVVAYLLEGSRPRQRGLITSIASAASEIGALLAVGVSAITVSLVSDANLDNWGWRIPFFIGAALASIVWIARSTMQESPDFARHRIHGVTSSLRDTLIHHRAAIGRTFAISALGSITYYVGITYVPTFLTSAGIFTERDSLWLSTVAALAVIFITPLVGGLSDLVGRKPMLIALALASIFLPLALFFLMASAQYSQAMLGVIVMACLAGGVSAVGPSSTAEQFPIEARLMGLALGATAATTIFGGLTPYIAQVLMGHTGSRLVPGIMIAIVALCVLPIFIRMPETAPRKLEKPFSRASS